MLSIEKPSKKFAPEFLIPAQVKIERFELKLIRVDYGFARRGRCSCAAPGVPGFTVVDGVVLF